MDKQKSKFNMKRIDQTIMMLFVIVALVILTLSTIIYAQFIEMSRIESAQIKKTNTVLSSKKTVTTQPQKASKVVEAQATEAVDPAEISTCQSEIYKYDWDRSVATAVMLAESGGNTNALNNNPSTKDYSVGCFQVNLYGDNKYSRPSEDELKNAAVNVAFAYSLYTSNGGSFLGSNPSQPTWGVCIRGVACY